MSALIFTVSLWTVLLTGAQYANLAKALFAGFHVTLLIPRLGT